MDIYLAFAEEQITKREYSPEEFDHFVEIAFGSQYGLDVHGIHKWNHDVRIQIIGKATAEDKATLNRITTELNSLVQGISIVIVHSVPTTKLYFASPSKFTLIEPHYIPPHIAFYWSRWDAASIIESTILIASEGITQHKRDHHIVAMMTKNLGLMNRSSSLPPESIFFNGETESIFLVDIDRAIVQILYDASIRHGMTVDETRAALPVSSVDVVTRASGQLSAPHYCPNCGSGLEGTEQYCGTCGSPVTSMN